VFDEAAIKSWESSLPDDVVRFLRARPGRPEMAGQLIFEINNIVLNSPDIESALRQTAHIFGAMPEELDLLGRPRRIRHLSWLFFMWFQRDENGYVFNKFLEAVAQKSEISGKILTDDMRGFIKRVMAARLAAAALSPEAVSSLYAAAATLRGGLVLRAMDAKNG
jgi:hypothetical protein